MCASIEIVIYIQLWLFLVVYSYVTGFTKTISIDTRNEIQFIADY